MKGQRAKNLRTTKHKHDVDSMQDQRSNFFNLKAVFYWFIIFDIALKVLRI